MSDTQPKTKISLPYDDWAAVALGAETLGTAEQDTRLLGLAALIHRSIGNTATAGVIEAEAERIETAFSEVQVSHGVDGGARAHRRTG